MTRGIIIIKDEKHQEVLYLSSNAFVGGDMDFVIEYLDEHHGSKISVKEVAFDLMKAIPDLQIYSMNSNPGLDYVYTLQINSGLCPNDFVYQKVLPDCSFDEAVPVALSEGKFYRAKMEKKQSEAESYWEYKRKLENSILPCPHCGSRGWHNITPKGERVRCFVDVCQGSTVGKWHEKFEDAIEEWNQYVMQNRK
jgi:hypothetical protein